MKKLTLLILVFIAFVCNCYAQKVITFQDAAKQGISYQHLDSLYKSAVHSDPKLAVFKTKEDQQKLQTAYINFMQGLGAYLKANNFRWEKQVHCFNRIYFAPNGKVDYFLYNFPPGEISAAKEQEFTNLLSQFVKNNQFGLTANERFAQCSPIKYAD